MTLSTRFILHAVEGTSSSKLNEDDWRLPDDIVMVGMLLSSVCRMMRRRCCEREGHPLGLASVLVVNVFGVCCGGPWFTVSRCLFVGVS